MNRAQRRRAERAVRVGVGARRNRVVATAGLALTATIAGLNPGGSRLPRAYGSVLPTTANCDVGNWSALGDAIDSFNLGGVATDNASKFTCSTITFTADISDSGSTADLAQINVGAGRSFRLNGADKQLAFTGDTPTNDARYGVFVSGAVGASVTISNLEVTDTPKSNGAETAHFDVTMDSAGAGTVTVENSWFHDAANTGALIVTGGPGIDVLVDNTEFSNVSAYLSAVGIDSNGAGAPDLTVTESFFDSNYGYYWGALFSIGAVTVSDSTFAHNSGSYTGAGAISTLWADVTIENSTFYDNYGSYAGSVWTGTNFAGATMTIDHSTFFGGSANGTPANEIVLDSRVAASGFSLTNSVVWGGGSVLPDVWVDVCSSVGACPAFGGTFPITVANSAYGLLDGEGYSLTATANIPTSGLNAADLVFGDHGGTVLPSSRFGAPAGHIPTFLPAATSPLIDAAGTTALVLDQRGLSRPYPVGGSGDMGSVETRPADYGPVQCTSAPTSPQIGPGADGTQVSFTAVPTDCDADRFQVRCMPLGLPVDTASSTEVRYVYTTTLPVIVPNLVTGKTYHCKVREQFTGTDPYEGPLSDWSNERAISYTAPAAPGGVSATRTASRTARVSFTPPSDGGAPITDYDVQYSTSPTFASGVTFYEGGTTTGSSVDVTGLTNGTTYYFRVRASNAAGNGAWSAITSGVKLYTTPGTPTGVTAARVASQTVRVSFTAPGNGGSAITDYDIEYSLSPTFASGVAFYEGGTTTNSYVDVNGLVNGATYYFRVRATNAAGDGAWSAISSGAKPYTNPGAPTGATAARVASQTVRVSFTAPGNGGSAITDYDIQYSTSPTFASGVTFFEGGTTTASSVNVTGLTNGTTYYFRVRATNAAGNSPWSTITNGAKPS